MENELVVLQELPPTTVLSFQKSQVSSDTQDKLLAMNPMEPRKLLHIFNE